jgi:hypothetical protein
MKLKAFMAVCALVASSAAGLVACGSGEGARSANVPAGEMPTGESWNGVYFHPVYGYLHLKEEGSNVIGRWKRTDQSAWGELSGTSTGNVLHYQWKEHKIGLVGPSAETSGKGYFVYKPGKEEGIYELDGQFGMNQNETGSDWHNVKQQRMNPDLKSINGDTGGVAPPAAGKWE